MNYGITWVCFMICVALGALIGAYIGIEIYKSVNHFGTLVVDMTDPEKDVFRIELDMDLNKVTDKDYIILKVDKHTKKKVININQVQEE